MTFSHEDLTPDFDFFQGGPVSLFLKTDVLDKALTTFRSLDYVVGEISTASRDTIYRDMGEAYDWPGLFGYAPPNNLDALNDGVTDGNGPRRVLVFRAFDTFHAGDPAFAHALIDMLAAAAHRNMMFAERLAIFLQVSDPRFRLEGLGGCDAWWNPAEWMMADRGL